MMTAPQAVVLGCLSLSRERWLGRSPSWNVWVRREAEVGEAAPVTPSWSLSNGTTASNPGVGLDTTMSAKTQNSSPVLWGGREQLGGLGG